MSKVETNEFYLGRDGLTIQRPKSIGQAWRRMIMMRDNIIDLRQERLNLKEQVAALESKEVCTRPHDDDVIEGCPYCEIEELRGMLITSTVTRYWIIERDRAMAAEKRVAELEAP